MDAAVFAERRRQLMATLGPDAIAVFPAAPERTRSNDVEYRYRQQSDFYYLTGFAEPGALCVLQPGHADHEYVLFVRPRDRERETWTGRRAGVEGADDRLRRRPGIRDRGRRAVPAEVDRRARAPLLRARRRRGVRAARDALVCPGARRPPAQRHRSGRPARRGPAGARDAALQDRGRAGHDAEGGRDHRRGARRRHARGPAGRLGVRDRGADRVHVPPPRRGGPGVSVDRRRRRQRHDPALHRRTTGSSARTSCC